MCVFRIFSNSNYREVDRKLIPPPPPNKFKKTDKKQFFLFLGDVSFTHQKIYAFKDCYFNKYIKGPIHLIHSVSNIIRIMSISNNRSSKFRDFTVYIMYRAKGLMCMCIRTVWLQHSSCSLTSYTKRRHDRSI